MEGLQGGVGETLESSSRGVGMISIAEVEQAIRESIVEGMTIAEAKQAFQDSLEKQ